MAENIWHWQILGPSKFNFIIHQNSNEWAGNVAERETTTLEIEGPEEPLLNRGALSRGLHER